MSEIHRKSVGALLLEVVLIGIAVFLGLLADEWRDGQQHNEMAKRALVDFREEILANKGMVERVVKYHVEMRDRLEEFIKANGPKDAAAFRTMVRFDGTKPVIYERSAWELAVANQALTYIKPDIAFRLSKLYTRQRYIESFQTSFMQGLLSPQAFSQRDLVPLSIALNTYFTDISMFEPGIITAYDEAARALNAELGSTPPAAGQ